LLRLTLPVLAAGWTLVLVDLDLFALVVHVDELVLVPAVLLAPAALLSGRHFAQA
jgi:hypothetical protein